MAKGRDGVGNADSGRGASALKDGLRLVYTQNKLTEEEARAIVRIDSGKVNVAPSEATRWFKFIGVSLGNTTEQYPDGDNVGVLVTWEPPAIMADITQEIRSKILDDIDNPADGVRYSNHPTAKDRAAWQVVEKHLPGKGETAGRKVIAVWIKNGLLEYRHFENPKDRHKAKGLFVSEITKAFSREGLRE